MENVKPYHLRYFSWAYFSVIILAFAACNTPAEEVRKAQITTQESEISIEEKLKSLGIDLPEVSSPVANYLNAVTSGSLVFLSGKGPKKADGTYIKGKLGADLSIEEGQEAARICAINQLAALKAEIGDLNRVRRIVKVTGMVNATPDFEDHPKVINGFSNLMVEVFGDRGKHARAAVGMGSLPFNIAVEIDMIVEID